MKQIFPNLDGIICDYSSHIVSEETGEPTRFLEKEVNCPESTSCVLVTLTFSPDYSYGESKENRIKS